MSARAFAWTSVLREWRSGEFALLFAALTLAVAAMTAVGFFTDRVSRAVDRQAAEMLAADLVLRSGRPPEAGLYERAAQAGLETARKVSMASVTRANGRSALADVEGVSAGYPLRGEIRVARSAFGEPEHAEGVPAQGEAWAEPRLLAQLGIDVGARLALGALELEVTRALDFLPDRGWSFTDFAPALIVNADDIPASGLVQPGSRVYYYALFAGSPPDVRRFADTLRGTLEPGERLRDVDSTRPEIRSVLDRARRFLGLSALAGTLLAAVAVAMAARRYAERHLDTAALLKCLGASQARVTRTLLVQLLALAAAGGIAGTLLGLAAHAVLSTLTEGLLGAALPAPSLGPLWIGPGVALVLLAGFALPPMLALRRVPPLRVLRRDAGSLQLSQVVLYLSAIASVAALLAWIARDPRLVMYVLIGAALTIALAALAGAGLVSAVRRLRGGVGVAWRYGLANIGRRGSGSVVQLVAFSLGLMVLLLLTLVRTQLLDTWRARLPDEAPNHFLINIPPDAVEPVRALLVERVGAEPELAPVVRARLSAIRGVSVRELELDEAGRRFADRESNLTWIARLRDDNRLAAGTWWPEAAGDAQVSVELEFAHALGIALGDALTFDIAGETVSAEVTSLREVQWDSLQPNFFMILKPELLADYPASYIASVYLPEGSERVLLELVEQHPSVTPIDMNAIFTQVRGVMDRAALAVQFVFGFTLVAGVLVLAAAVQATRDQRLYESAVLRTLGASRSVISRGLAAEFGMLGLMSGALAAAGASAAGYLLATQVFELALTFSPTLWLAGLAGGALLVGGSGILATRSVARQPPLQSLRDAS